MHLLHQPGRIFSKVRVAGLIQLAELGDGPQRKPDKPEPGEALAQISLRAHELVAEQYRVLKRRAISRPGGAKHPLYPP